MAWEPRGQLVGDDLVDCRRRDCEQLTDMFEIVFANAAGEQAVMADAVKASRQIVKQEAPDELVRGERHDLLPVGATPAIVLVAEGDAVVAEADKSAVRDGDPVGVARQIGKDRLGSSEWRLGVDHPALFPDRRKMAQESASFAEMRHASVEAELPAIEEGEQARDEQAAE